MNRFFRAPRPPVWTRILAAACLLLAGCATGRSADELESTRTNTQYIPRSYVIGRDGTILCQTVGYKAEEFVQLVSAIEKELARKP